MNDIKSDADMSRAYLSGFLAGFGLGVAGDEKQYRAIVEQLLKEQREYRSESGAA